VMVSQQTRARRFAMLEWLPAVPWFYLRAMVPP
jgi:hypothetical protein